MLQVRNIEKYYGNLSLTPTAFSMVLIPFHLVDAVLIICINLPSADSIID